MRWEFLQNFVVYSFLVATGNYFLKGINYKCQALSGESVTHLPDESQTQKTYLISLVDCFFFLEEEIEQDN